MTPTTLSTPPASADSSGARAAPAEATTNTCANCAHVLTGPFCASCGQEARDLRRPFSALVGESIGDVFDLDARLVRTVRPLLLKPGEVTRRYRLGQRVTFVPPLKTYLVAALVFFGLFSLLPLPQGTVFVQDSPEHNAWRAKQPAEKSEAEKLTVSLPPHMWFRDEAYQRTLVRAREHPEQFFAASYASVPRLFFVFLPLFALYLELFYRKQGYYHEHLVFSLYYHAFVFAMLALMVAVSSADAILPRWIQASVGYLGWTWIVVHLPMALQRVYGGAKWKTALKVFGLWFLYLATVIVVGLPLLMALAIMTFEAGG